MLMSLLFAVNILIALPGPAYQTKVEIDRTARRIQRYMRQHQTPPPNLSALPDNTGPPIDAWDREFFYSVDKDGVVTLGLKQANAEGVRGDF
jgi:hypothetical protein